MSEAPISARPHAFYIRPAPGWLELLHEEVQSILQSPFQKYKYDPKVTLLKGTVKLHRCDWRQGLEVMLRLTTAHDVEWLILESKCTRWSEVEAILERVPWDDIVPNREVPVHVTSEVSKGFTTNSAKLRELFCKVSRLNHFSEGGEFRFKIELRSDFLRVSISLCGEPLYKRGYKAQLKATAPLPEHQAAACVHWVLQPIDKTSEVSQIFIPFAGSGTLGFETLLVMSGSGPGAFLRKFSCESFPCVSSATMGYLRRKLQDKLKKASIPELVFNEINSETVTVLRENILSFFQEKDSSEIKVIEGDLFETSLEFKGDNRILILLNPPYGDRLAKNSSVVQLYGKLGQWLRNKMDQNPYRVVGGCLCPDESTWRKFVEALKSDTFETHHFTHGGKEIRLVRWH